MRTALFVDFDNVFSGLMRLGPAYAEAFARHPSRWLAWLTDQVPLPTGAEPGRSRRVLVRRCYLNPEPYKRFRIGFSRAGFEIIDCPPMTTAGKTSTDIHMVLDIVDVLQASTRYDEFVLFSADADFTPVLRKLRREDRRTTIFAAGATSASYDASADLILDPEVFIRDGLGFHDEETAAGMPDLDSLVSLAEDLVWRVVDQSDQPVPLPALTKALAQQIPDLPLTQWAGKGTFFALLKSLPLAPLRIDRELNAVLDPRRLAQDSSPANGRSASLPTPQDSAPPTAMVPPPSQPQAQAQTASPLTPQLQAQLEEFIAQEVRLSSHPIPMARLAQLAREALPGIGQDWAGQGSWKKLLDGIHPRGARIVWQQLAGYALDPQRHAISDLPARAEAASPSSPHPDASVVEPLLEAANLPALDADRYRALLEALSEALDAVPVFQLADATKAMRDGTQARGKLVSRMHCNALLRTLLFNGFRPDTDPHGFDDLVAATCGVIVAAAAREGLRIGDSERQALVAWMMASPR